MSQPYPSKFPSSAMPPIFEMPYLSTDARHINNNDYTLDVRTYNVVKNAHIFILIKLILLKMLTPRSCMCVIYIKQKF